MSTGFDDFIFFCNVKTPDLLIWEFENLVYNFNFPEFSVFVTCSTV